MKTIKVKVHMLPTEDESHIHLFKDEVVYFTPKTSKKGITGERQPHHLYITTDEEIKKLP